MASHLQMMALYAGFVSLVFAVLLRDDPRAQVLTGLRMFGSFLGAALLIGWVLFALPR